MRVFQHLVSLRTMAGLHTAALTKGNFPENQLGYPTSHSPHSPDLAPSGFHLFSLFKELLGAKKIQL